jgi:hypothetical protein
LTGHVRTGRRPPITDRTTLDVAVLTPHGLSLRISVQRSLRDGHLPPRRLLGQGCRGRTEDSDAIRSFSANSRASETPGTIGRSASPTPAHRPAAAPRPTPGPGTWVPVALIGSGSPTRQASCPARHAPRASFGPPPMEGDGTRFSGGSFHARGRCCPGRGVRFVVVPMGGARRCELLPWAVPRIRDTVCCERDPPLERDGSGVDDRG